MINTQIPQASVTAIRLLGLASDDTLTLDASLGSTLQNTVLVGTGTTSWRAAWGVTRSMGGWAATRRRITRPRALSL